MIPAEQLSLITAAVDGELSAPEARAFRRLMDGSAEARALYVKLQSDSNRVRALPQASPPADLRAKVLARIAATTPAPVVKPKTSPAAQPTRPPQPAQPAPPHHPQTTPFRRGRAWVPVAVAASLLLCVSAGSFAYFNSQNPAKNRAVAKNPWSNALPVQSDVPPGAVPSPTAPAPQEVVRPDPDASARIDPVPVPKVVIYPPEIAPEPRPAHHDLHASRILPPLPPFDFIQVRVPFLRAVAELAREDIRQELVDELAHDPAFRFDLFVRDAARGAEVFQNAAKAAGLTLHADATTLDKLKKKQVSSVVIYTDNLTAAELTDLFAKVSAEDAKFSPRVCDSLHAAPVVRSDEYELKAIFGTDPGLYKRPGGSRGNGAGQGTKPDRTAEPKSISSDTIDSVVKTVTTPAKPGERTAVLMTWRPDGARTNPATSAELKSFLTKRPDRRLNAVPAIIVIRPVG